MDHRDEAERDVDLVVSILVLTWHDCDGAGVCAALVADVYLKTLFRQYTCLCYAARPFIIYLEYRRRHVPNCASGRLLHPGRYNNYLSIYGVSFDCHNAGENKTVSSKI
jgi:hypothetical protein